MGLFLRILKSDLRRFLVRYLLLASFSFIEKLGAVWGMGIEVFVDSAFHTDGNPESTYRVDVDPGTERNVVDMMPTFYLCAGILELSMGARNREGIGLYRRASLHTRKLPESNPWN